MNRLTLLILLTVFFINIQGQTVAKRLPLSKLPLNEVEKRANTGDAASQLELYKRYDVGKKGGYDIERDENKANEWLEKAAEQGNAEALYWMGMRYYSSSPLWGLGGDDPFKMNWKAMEYFIMAANQGHIFARNYIAYMYDNRLYKNEYNTKLNYDINALMWYILSVKGGNKDDIKYMYELENRMDKKDVAEAHKLAENWKPTPGLYKQSKQNEPAAAKNNVSVKNTKTDTSNNNFTKLGNNGLIHLANSGNAEAQLVLATRYINSKDYTNAMEWSLKAANQNEPLGQYFVATLYNGGLGTEQDYQKAMEWFLKSANQDYSEAQNTIGTMYLVGRGVNTDAITAIEWFKKAADNGNIDAFNKLAYTYFHNPKLAYNAPFEVYIWVSIAIKYGNKEGIEMLNSVKPLLDNDEILMAQKRINAWKPKK